MSNIETLRINTFLAQHSEVVIQKGKFLRQWSYQINFWGDLPKTYIHKFVTAQSLACEWTDSNRNLYFNDIRVKHFVDAVAENAHFCRVLTEKEALKEDQAWSTTRQFRVMFDPSLAPAFKALEEKSMPGDIVHQVRCHTQQPDGSYLPRKDVVAFLTDCEETAVLLKMSYLNTVLEER